MPSRCFARFVAASLLAGVVASYTAAQLQGAESAAGPASAQGIDFFEKKIRPVLVDRCYKCHSANSRPLQGGLRLDHRDGVMTGGDSGPAVVPGKPDESLLVEAVRYAQDALQMPPDGKLPSQAVADVEAWVSMGAPDPRTSALTPPQPKPIDVATAHKFWSFQPLSRAAAPAVARADWPLSDIDRFILRRLENEGVEPSADADPYTLLRRVTLDLSGLPPTPAQIAAFVADSRPDAYERLVDRLLASPHFGERWARHWLDVVRYSDSNGAALNFTFDTAWRYRDFVIESLNRDKPYDHFIRQQIAGDLLPYASGEEQAENLIATAFLMFGAKQIAQYDKPKLRMDVIDEQIDTTGRALLGLTIGCARCHDHKFDPIPTKDYYAIAGIFHSTITLEGSWTDNGLYSGWKVRPLPLAVSDEHKQALTDHRVAMDQARKRLRAKQAELRTLEKKLESLAGIVAATDNAPSSAPGELSSKMTAMKSEVTRLDDEFNRVQDAAPPPLPEVMAVAEQPKPADIAVHIRGATENLGTVVSRGFLKAASFSSAPTIDPARSGRMELADWLVSPENPLTSRVIVNRVWAHLLGEGLVRSVDNFGARGEPPTHPELLDYLAGRMIDDNWSIKSLVRRIVLSRVYRLSSDFSARVAQTDPENRLLARHRRHRLDGDAIRDAMLSVSGQLDSTRGGPTLPFTGLLYSKGLYHAAKNPKPWKRRSIYFPILRDGQLPEGDLLEIFDFPDPNVVTGRRNETTVPTQALYLMNSPAVAEYARGAAERLLAGESNDARRVRLAYLAIWGRPPSQSQQTEAQRFVEESLSTLVAKSDPERRLAVWSSLCHTLLGTSGFLYLD